MWHKKRSGIMLAYPFNDGRIERNFTTPYIVQPKLNGERCRIITNKEGEATLLSSEENVIISVPHIKKAVEALKLSNIEMDGELYHHGWSLQKIHSVVSRKKSLHDDYKDITFNLFDIVTHHPQKERFNLIFKYLSPVLTPPLLVVETTPCFTIEEVNALLIEYMEEGFEGIIVRAPQAFYYRKRVTTMLKWKPRKSDCYLIVGYSEEVSIYGEPKCALGSITCSADGEEFNIGTGPYFTREHREVLWETRNLLPGKYAVIKYPELTDRGVPSHPVCMSISDVMVSGDED